MQPCHFQASSGRLRTMIMKQLVHTLAFAMKYIMTSKLECTTPCCHMCTRALSCNGIQMWEHRPHEPALIPIDQWMESLNMCFTCIEQWHVISMCLGSTWLPLMNNEAGVLPDGMPGLLKLKSVLSFLNSLPDWLHRHVQHGCMLAQVGEHLDHHLLLGS